MKKFAAALALGVALTAGAAFADTLTNGYGNTFVVTSANGEARYHFDEDGSFHVTFADGNTVSGTYAVEGDQLCLTPEGGEAACAAYVGDKNVGDTWTQAAADGGEISVTLEAGR